jgi:hypothetical protein
MGEILHDCSISGNISVKITVYKGNRRYRKICPKLLTGEKGYWGL